MENLELSKEDIIRKLIEHLEQDIKSIQGEKDISVEFLYKTLEEFVIKVFPNYINFIREVLKENKRKRNEENKSLTF